MRFYYISILSVLMLAVIYLIGTGLLVWLGTWLRKRSEHAWVAVMPLFLLLYVGPVAEEFWIAWNFGQLCKKDAGIFIYKTVEVEGFYDDTTHWWRQLAESNYKFVESRDRTYGGLWRVERVGKGIRHFKIDRPTAMFHYEKDSGLRTAHKVYRQTSSVVDAKSKELLGRYIRYSRQAPWFFIGLDRSGFGCDGPDGGPNTRYSFLIYREILRPHNLSVGK